jgi:Fe-S cluster assembly protein SufD
VSTAFVAGFAAQQSTLPSLYGSGIPALSALRERGLARFVEQGVPHTDDEDWRYADLRPLDDVQHAPAKTIALADPREHGLVDYLLGGFAQQRIVFVNGAFAPAISSTAAPLTGITCQPLSAAAALHAEICRAFIGHGLDIQRHPLAALNTALHKDGLFVHCAAGRKADGPIHAAFLSTAEGGPRAVHPRGLIVLESAAHATLVLSFQGSGALFVNAAIEIFLGEDATLDLVLLQEESEATTHTLALNAAIAGRGQCRIYSASLGGKLARTEIHARLAEAEAELSLDALLVGGHDQTHDLTARIHHSAVHTKSRQSVKSVLDDASRGAFSGRVEVAPGADGTNATQSSRSLILAPSATMNTRPELVIHADDVRCSHGATYGQLDPEALFYLRSRGIEAGEARVLLTRAFADEIIDRFPLESMRKHLHARVDGRIARKGLAGVLP